MHTNDAPRTYHIDRHRGDSVTRVQHPFTRLSIIGTQSIAAFLFPFRDIRTSTTTTKHILSFLSLIDGAEDGVPPANARAHLLVVRFRVAMLIKVGLRRGLILLLLVRCRGRAEVWRTYQGRKKRATKPHCVSGSGHISRVDRIILH